MDQAVFSMDEDQGRILAIDILREGFNLLLASAVLSTHNQELYGSVQEWKSRLNNSEVRCQWDPDRDIHGNPINTRAIQIGLKGSAVIKYVNNWIVRVLDISNNVHNWGQDVRNGTFDHSLLPEEKEYPVDLEIKQQLD